MAKACIGEKTASLMSRAGKIGSPHVGADDTRVPFLMLHRNKNQREEMKTRNLRKAFFVFLVAIFLEIKT